MARLLAVFEERGYCLKAEVTDVAEDGAAAGSGGGGGGRFTVRLTGPANLWGLGALASQGAAVANTHDAMAVDAYLRASGRRGGREIELTDTGYVERWVVA